MLQSFDYQDLKKQYGLHWQKLMLLLKVPNHGYIDERDLRKVAQVNPELTGKCWADLNLEILAKKDAFADVADVIVLVDW